MNQSNNNSAGVYERGAPDGVRVGVKGDIYVCMDHIHKWVAREILERVGVVDGDDRLQELFTVDGAVVCCTGCGHTCYVNDYLEHFSIVAENYIRFWRERRWSFFLEGVERGIVVKTRKDVDNVLELMTNVFQIFIADFDSDFLDPE